MRFGREAKQHFCFKGYAGMTLKIGTDPEFFLKKDNKFVSAFGIVPGTKAKPFPVDSGAVQVDGMALEFNIEPAEDSDKFVTNIHTVLKILRDMVPEEFDFAYEAVAKFPASYLKKQPMMARMLGCDPDFDAYLDMPNEPPDNQKPMRTAAGHVHVGWRDAEPINLQHLEECRLIAKQLDYILGVPSVVLDPNGERRKMYGKAGAYRPKSYGVEYRVLSNFWLKTDALMAWVFESTKHGFELLVEQGINLSEMYGETAKQIIDGNDKEQAEYFLENDLKQFVNLEGVA